MTAEALRDAHGATGANDDEEPHSRICPGNRRAKDRGRRRDPPHCEQGVIKCGAGSKTLRFAVARDFVLGVVLVRRARPRPRSFPDRRQPFCKLWALSKRSASKRPAEGDEDDFRNPTAAWFLGATFNHTPIGNRVKLSSRASCSGEAMLWSGQSRFRSAMTT